MGGRVYLLALVIITPAWGAGFVVSYFTLSAVGAFAELAVGSDLIRCDRQLRYSSENSWQGSFNSAFCEDSKRIVLE